MIVSDLYVLEHTQRVFGKHCRGAIQRHQVGSNRVAVNPHKTDGKAGSLFARPGQAGTAPPRPASFRRCAADRMLVFPSPLISILSVGISGMPRQVRNGEPKIVAGGGGTPRQRAFTAKGGDGAWMRQKEGRFLPDAREQFIQIVGGGRTLGATLILNRRIDIVVAGHSRRC